MRNGRAGAVLYRVSDGGGVQLTTPHEQGTFEYEAYACFCLRDEHKFGIRNSDKNMRIKKFGVKQFGFRNPDSPIRKFGFGNSDSEIRAHKFRFKNRESEIRIQKFGFRNSGSEIRI